MILYTHSPPHILPELEGEKRQYFLGKKKKKSFDVHIYVKVSNSVIVVKNMYHRKCTQEN